jgi:1-acyl-sn-glycerol-3-phosphate acyltransferase
MTRALQSLFFWLVVRPIVLIGLGLNVRHRERLPAEGPAIVVANHNSHLDTVVLMTLLPSRLLHRLRPVAAADYFLRNRLVAWFALRIMGIIPIERRGATPDADPLAAFKSGVAHLARKHPHVPVIPVFMHGLGKTLPKGAVVPVPFFCDVFVGEALFGTDDHRVFMRTLTERMQAIAGEGKFAVWE